MNKLLNPMNQNNRILNSINQSLCLKNSNTVYKDENREENNKEKENKIDNDWLYKIPEQGIFLLPVDKCGNSR